MTIPRKEVLQAQIEKEKIETEKVEGDEEIRAGDVVELVQVARVYLGDDKPLGLIVQSEEDVETVLHNLQMALVKVGSDAVTDSLVAQAEFEDPGNRQKIAEEAGLSDVE